jgi:hypothetical protein
MFFIIIIIIIIIPKLLERLLTTWLQAEKHTKVHSLDVNFKTHVQGK